jgi:hypothetical protein
MAVGSMSSSALQKDIGLSSIWVSIDTLHTKVENSGGSNGLVADGPTLSRLHWSTGLPVAGHSPVFIVRQIRVICTEDLDFCDDVTLKIRSTGKVYFFMIHPIPSWMHLYNSTVEEKIAIKRISSSGCRR